MTRLLLFISGALMHVLAWPQTAKRCNELWQLWDLMNSYHVSAPALDDSLSTQMFEIFIDHLDERSMIFMKPDIDRLSAFRYELDNMIFDRDCAFIDAVAELYDKRLTDVDTIIGSILELPSLNYFIREEITLSSSPSHIYQPTRKELEARWTQWVKAKVIRKLFNKSGEDEDPFNLDVSTLLTREAKVRKEICLREKRKLTRIREYSADLKNYLFYLFFNSLTECFDPHTMYFSLNDKEDFEESLSTENLSFGIEVDDNLKHEVEIKSLVPGGPAWKSNLLNVGDVILSVKLKNQPEVDASMATADEIVEMLWKRNVKEMEITVRKLSGAVKTVKLIKEKIQSDENVIHSFILDGDVRVGYLSLPAFYRDETSAGLLGCANDVAKEILLLKRENIQALILDLRNNGGGSVGEALDLTGLFIDVGPVTVSKDRIDNITVLKDVNRGTIYDGPLVVLVNGSTASASEIFAGAIQDYKRGIIVGTNTYGKATGQQILPISAYRNSEMGFVKLTLTRYFRITNESHQKRGIVPDIQLPDLFDGLDYREENQKHALAPDTLVKKIYYTPYVGWPVAKLRELSRKRVMNNHAFNSVINVNNMLRDFYLNDLVVPLHIEDYKQSRDDLVFDWDQWDSLMVRRSELYNLQNHGFASDRMKMDEYSREANNLIIENLSKDMYIEEAFRIISDFINFEK